MAIQNAGTPSTTVQLTFDPALGDGTDIAIAVIHDETTDRTLCGTAARADAQIDVPIPLLDQAALTKLHAYLVFSKPPARGISEQGEVSNTAYTAVPPAYAINRKGAPAQSASLRTHEKRSMLAV